MGMCRRLIKLSIDSRASPTEDAFRQLCSSSTSLINSQSSVSNKLSMYIVHTPLISTALRGPAVEVPFSRRAFDGGGASLSTWERADAAVIKAGDDARFSEVILVRLKCR